MAFIRILAYNKATGQYDVPISIGDESSPATIGLSKLKAMAGQERFLVEKSGKDVYQARLSFVNDTKSYWSMASDVSGAPGAFTTSMALSAFPTFIWLKATCPGGESIDGDSSVSLKAVANQDYVSLPSISSTDNTRTASVAEYNASNPAACEARLSAWPAGEVRKIKSVTVFVRAGGAGTLYIYGKTQSGNNEVQKAFSATPGTRTVTVDLISPEPFKEVVLRSYSAAAPTTGSYGTVSNIVILSDPNPATDLFDTLRKLLLLGDADFETSRMAALPGLITEFDSEIIGYASTDYAADTSRKLLLGDQEAIFDSMVRTAYSGKVEAETKRIASRIEVLVGDTLRKTKRTGELSGDTIRRTVIYFDAPFDTTRKTKGYFEQFLDTVRKLEERPVKKNYYFIS